MILKLITWQNPRFTPQILSNFIQDKQQHDIQKHFVQLKLQ